MVLFGKFRPDDPKTEGMFNTARISALELLNEIFSVWEPSHQTWLLNNSGKVAATVAMIPAVYFTFRFRRLFGLHINAKARDMIYYLPVAPLCGTFAYALHKAQVRDDIVLQIIVYDVTGIIIPTGMTYFATLIYARNNNIRMYPNNFKAFKVLTQGVFAKIYAPLIALTVIQLGCSAYLVQQLYSDRDTVMGELEARYDYEQQLLNQKNLR